MRMIGALLATAALIAAAVWFADHPGRVAIVWQGWRVETSVAVLTAATALAAFAVVLLLRMLRLILGSPRALLRRRRERRRRAGYRALSRGMVAVAAGDPQEAKRHARRADALLAEPPLTLLLSAQAAQLAGDESAAKNYFTAMLERPETEFLGLRGLFNQAMHEGERATAMRLAERARVLRPNAGWVARSLLDLEVRDGKWEAARDTLARAAKRGSIPAERGRHQRGVILYELSRAAIAAGDRRHGIALAAEAQGLTPDLAAPAGHHARLLLAEGRTGAAAKAIERAWHTAPDPALARLYAEIGGDEAPLARVKRFERLASQNPDACESHAALAEAALAAQLWGEARRHLEQTLAVPIQNAASAGPEPTSRACLLMARLEEAEHQDFTRVREWLDRAASAAPDPRYVCSNCRGENLEWRSLCPHCGSFDALHRRVPVRAVSAAVLPPATVPLAIFPAKPPAVDTAAG